MRLQPKLPRYSMWSPQLSISQPTVPSRATPLIETLNFAARPDGCRFARENDGEFLQKTH
jgi:hypothetical protein